MFGRDRNTPRHHHTVITNLHRDSDLHRWLCVDLKTNMAVINSEFRWQWALVYGLGILVCAAVFALQQTNVIPEDKAVESVPRKQQWIAFSTVVGVGVLVVLAWLALINVKSMRAVTFSDTTAGSIFWFGAHFVLGLFAPALWPLTLGVGIAWELIECHVTDWGALLQRFVTGNFVPAVCSGYPDVITNVAGMTCGAGPD